VAGVLPPHTPKNRANLDECDNKTFSIHTFFIHRGHLEFKTPVSLGLYLMAALVLSLVQGVPMNLIAMGQVDFLPDLGLAALQMWILTFGIGEEIGWRGFALPGLQAGRSALRATVIL
jgi:membrane protease YdiL (CAAX protease family)